MVKKQLIWGLIWLQGLYGSYEEYLSHIQDLGDYRKGEIEIIIDPLEIMRIEEIQKNRLLQKGFSEENAEAFSRTGILWEDQYYLFIRDAVCFPKGIVGTYDRLIWKSALKASHCGIAIMPILPTGKIALNLNYRHATRSWELELPRGMTESTETKEEAALRELKEETGLQASSLIYLGDIASESGILSGIVPIFMGKISSQTEAVPEYTEAISDILSFSKEEIKEGLIQGFIEVNIDGKQRKVPIRDPFLSFAFLQAELRNLL